MPMYYFNLYNHVEVLDDDGTDLINLAAALVAANINLISASSRAATAVRSCRSDSYSPSPCCLCRLSLGAWSSLHRPRAVVPVVQ